MNFKPKLRICNNFFFQIREPSAKCLFVYLCVTIITKTQPDKRLKLDVWCLKISICNKFWINSVNRKSVICLSVYVCEHNSQTQRAKCNTFDTGRTQNCTSVSNLGQNPPKGDLDYYVLNFSYKIWLSRH